MWIDPSIYPKTNVALHARRLPHVYLDAKGVYARTHAHTGHVCVCVFGVCMYICLHVCLVCACISAYMYVWCVHAYLLTCMVCVQVLVLTRDGLFKRIAMRGLPMFSRRSCTHAHMHKQIRVRVLVFSMRGLLLLSLRWSVSTCVYLRKCV